MKKLLLTIWSLLLMGVTLGCDQFNTCADGEHNFNGYCVDNPSLTEINQNEYELFYACEDYVIYKKTTLSEVGTDDVVEFGSFEGDYVYFSSGTHHLYYLLIQDEEIYTLIEAFNLGIFTIKTLATEFDIEELYIIPEA